MESDSYQNGNWHMPKWKVAYTRIESGIYQCGIFQIYMWNISMFFLYNRYCMIDIFAGQWQTPCSQGRAQTQAFPSKCLDERFAFQCVNLVPQGRASSIVYWTLRWAYHTSHRAPLRRDHAGAPMFMRSTPGCKTLAGPSLEWVALSVLKTECIRRKSRSEAARRAWKTRNARKRPAEEEESSWRYMTCIYLTYTYHIWLLSKTCFSRDCVMSRASECICTYWFRLAVAISLLFLQ